MGNNRKIGLAFPFFPLTFLDYIKIFLQQSRKLDVEQFADDSKPSLFANFANNKSKFKFFMRSSADKKRLVQKHQEADGVVPETFAANQIKKPKKRTGLTELINFYSEGPQKKIEGDDGDERDEIDDVHFEEDGHDDELEGKDSHRISIHITKEVFIPRLFAKAENGSGNVPVNVVTPKQPMATPPPEEFLEFSISDSIVKVQGKDDGVLGKV